MSNFRAPSFPDPDPSVAAAVTGGGDDSVIHREQQLARAPLPANVTYNDLIRANKRKSTLLMIGMSMLLVVIGATFAAAIVAWGGGGRTDFQTLIPSIILGAIAAAIVASIASAWSFYGGSSAILSISGAKEIPREADVQLHNVVEELAIAAGIPKPRVFLINDTALNAFATGRDPQHAAVAITIGLRQQLTRDELAGVMAHELSHVRNYDIRFAMLMATMVGLIVFACDAFWRILRVQMWSGGGRRSSSRDSKGGGGGGAAVIYIVIFVIAIVLAIIAPTLAMMIRLAVSRQREYLADAGAVELTRYPQGLISALQKLGADREPLEVANRATAHMYIVNPLKSAMQGEGHNLDTVFATHPPLQDRIARLQALIYGQTSMPMQQHIGQAIVLLLVIAAVIAVIKYPKWRDARRRRKLATLATQLGFKFAPELNAKHQFLFPLEVFSGSRGDVAFNTLSGNVEVNGSKSQVWMEMDRATLSGGRNSAKHYVFSYVLLPFPVHDQSVLRIRHERYSDKIAATMGHSDINFESAEFSRRFLVTCQDKKFAYDILHPRMMEFLLAAAPPGIDIEKGYLCITDGRSLWEPQVFVEVLTWVEGFISLP